MARLRDAKGRFIKAPKAERLPDELVAGLRPGPLLGRYEAMSSNWHLNIVERFEYRLPPAQKASDEAQEGTPCDLV